MRSEKKFELKLSKMSPPIGSIASTALPTLNMFLTKNTITQGLLDVALLANNVAQLKYVTSLGASGPNAHPYFYPMMVLIWSSIALQVSTGLCLLLLGKIQIKDKEPSGRSETLNNAITAQVFLITVINILISSFNIEETVQRSGKLNEWLKAGNKTEYFNSCACINPLRDFHQWESDVYKIHCD